MGVEAIFCGLGVRWEERYYKELMRLMIYPISMSFGGRCKEGFFFVFVRFLLFGLLRAAPAAYGSSQARGRMGAAAAGLCHSYSNTRSEPCL